MDGRRPATRVTVTASRQSPRITVEARAARFCGTQVDRLRRLTRDCGRLLVGCVHTLRWLLSPAPARPGIGVVEGNSLARVGAPSAYLVRVCNPTSGPCSVRVSVRGWCAGAAGRSPSFHVVWDQILGSGESRARWVVTTWQDGSGVFVDSTPAVASALWGGDLEGQGGWMLEAVLADAGGRVLDRLVIGGEFLQ